MADQRLRELERASSMGDPGAFELLIQYIVRITGLSESQVAARYHFPNLYQWCLAAIAHETVYYIQEWFPQTDDHPTRAYLKYWTISFDNKGRPQLNQCWINSDMYSPHYQELVDRLRWVEIDRHPWGSWGQHFCFLGSSPADKLEDIFRLFGLHGRRGNIPHLTSLFSVHPNTYQEQFEEDPDLGYDVDEYEDDDYDDEN